MNAFRLTKRKPAIAIRYTTNEKFPNTSWKKSFFTGRGSLSPAAVSELPHQMQLFEFGRPRSSCVDLEVRALLHPHSADVNALTSVTINYGGFCLMEKIGTTTPNLHKKCENSATMTLGIPAHNARED